MGCTWEFSYDSCNKMDQAFLNKLGPDSTVLAKAEALAKDLLDNWTGGYFGLCEGVLRPCREEPACGGDYLFGSARVGATPWQPVLIGGDWFNVSCGKCIGGCTCEAVDFIVLPHPTHAVTRVRVDGQELPATAYSLEEHRFLVRTDGGKFPTCQNMDTPATEPGTFEVTLQYGLPLSEGGKVAAGILAMELAKSLCNDSTCNLPSRVQSVSRLGETITMTDFSDGIDQGKTGLWQVDAWLSSIRNPKRSQGGVMSPDYAPRPRRGVRQW